MTSPDEPSGRRARRRTTPESLRHRPFYVPPLWTPADGWVDFYLLLDDPAIGTLTFRTENGSLYVLNQDRNAFRRLLGSRGRPWSTDGESVAIFGVDVATSCGLVIAAVDGLVLTTRIVTVWAGDEIAVDPRHVTPRTDPATSSNHSPGSCGALYCSNRSA